MPIEIQSKLSSYMRREMNPDESKVKGYHRIPTCDMSFSPSSHGSHKNGKAQVEKIQHFHDSLSLFRSLACCCGYENFQHNTILLHY